MMMCNTATETHTANDDTRSLSLSDREASRRAPQGEGLSEDVTRPTSKEQELARAARKVFLKDERDRQVDQRIADEAKRQSDTAAKTARLRELRLAKEAAERAQPQVSGSGARLRKGK
jgi:hypothetical protein